ncbi:MAG: phasin family protein [Acidisphaera sp.]|nr:phasin family protein [Acidisphaera sp.]
MNIQTSKIKTIETIDAAAEAAKSAQREAGRATEQNFDQAVSAVKTGVAGAAAGFEQTQTQLKEQMQKAMKTAEELVAFGQGNLEALLKSGQIWVAGVQDLSRLFAANAQVTMDHTMSTFKAMAAVRSLKDAVDLQTNLARSTMEKAVSESGRLTDASVKLAEQAMAPIAARVSLAVEKFSKAA